ncbi:hypothetical protein D9M70_521940 [compost metagenome]
MAGARRQDHVVGCCGGRPVRSPISAKCAGGGEGAAAGSDRCISTPFRSLGRQGDSRRAQSIREAQPAGYGLPRCHRADRRQCPGSAGWWGAALHRRRQEEEPCREAGRGGYRGQPVTDLSAGRVCESAGRRFRSGSHPQRSTVEAALWQQCYGCQAGSRHCGLVRRAAAGDAEARNGRGAEGDRR